MKIKHITAVLLLILIPSVVLAVFLDTESSTNNIFSATTLNTEILPNSFEIDIAVVEEGNITFLIRNIGELNISNNIEIVDISNIQFAQAINAHLKYGSSTIYNGTLDNLSGIDYIDLSTLDSAELNLSLTMTQEDLDIYAQQDLTFKLINHSYQQGSLPNQGFYDNENIYFDIFNSTINEDE